VTNNPKETTWGQWESAGTVSEIRQALNSIEALRARVKTLGCEVKASSRIALLEEQLRPFLEPTYHPRTDRNFNPARMAHGVRDLFELSFISEKLSYSHAIDLAKALPELLSGSAIPNAEERNQLPRNLQFQFFIAARLVHSGFSVTLEEPDAVFVHREAALGVAAKRPVRKTQVVKRVREAVEQLDRKGLGGFIALSLDQLLGVANSAFIAKDETSLDAVAQALVQEALKAHGRDIQRVISRTTITGVIASYTVVGCMRVPWQPAYATATVWLARSDDLPVEKGLVKEVLKKFRHPF
jgi:hypothetical protein